MVGGAGPGNLQPGAALGPFRIERKLGAGGMGAVYEALDTRIGRRVALKVMLPDFSGNAAERFWLEARAAARLRHPNLVGLHSADQVGGVVVMVLELVPGTSLDARIKAGEPLAPEEAARLTRDLARGLAYAHQQGVLHRDVKPANVLLTPEGVPRLTDFGLAKSAEEAQGLTKTGEMLGTPSYMAPEQADGRAARADARADVWGLGATLFCMLTGRPPFVANSLPGLLSQVLTQPAPAPSSVRPGLPPALDAVCVRCLAKEVEDRYPSMDALADDLDRFLAGSLAAPSSSRRLGVALGVGLLALAAGGGLLSATSRSPAVEPTPARSSGRTVRSTPSSPGPSPASVKRPEQEAGAPPTPDSEFRPSKADQALVHLEALDAVRRDWIPCRPQGPTPGPRWQIQHGMTYDGKRRVVWLFGGADADGGFRNDLWTWNGSTWREEPQKGRRPSPRANHVLQYDPGRDCLVLWGGRQAPGTAPDPYVWELHGGTWTPHEGRSAGPRPRSHAACAYDALRKRVAIFGGVDRQSRYYADLWEWNGNDWVPLPSSPGPSSPRPRRGCGLAYEEGTGRLVLHGGAQRDGSGLNRLLFFDRSWTEATRGTSDPYPYYGLFREGHTLLAVGGRVIVWGGRSWGREPEGRAVTVSDRMLVHRGAGWFMLLPQVCPKPRCYHGSAYDWRRKRLVVYGGVEFTRATVWGKKFGDTWEYRLD